MREILFRGRSVDTGEWVQGDLSFDRNGNPHIRYWKPCGDEPTYTVVKVDSVTVGQYTGMQDASGAKLWEHDIIRYVDPDWNVFHAVIRYGEFTIAGMVRFDGFGAVWDGGEQTRNYRSDLAYWLNVVGTEIIGNIHDSPELLEVQK